MGAILNVSLIFSIYYRILFWNKERGISVILYIVPFLLSIIYLLKKNNKVNNKKAYFWCIPIILLSCMYLLFDNSFFNKWNILFIPLYILIFIIEIQNKNISLRNLLNEVWEALTVPINGMFNVFSDIKKLIFKEDNDKERDINLGNIIKGTIITLIVVSIVLFLLVSADNSFANLFSRIVNKVLIVILRFFRSIWKIFITLLHFMYLSSFLKLNILDYQEEKFEEKEPKNKDALTIKMILTALNLIYFLFVLIQIRTIITFDSWDYASYAREGFFQLVIVSIINFIAILVAKSKERFTENKKYIQISSIIAIGFTGILIILAGIRMYQYELYYGYTIKRTLVYFVLFTEIVLLIPTLLKIIGKNVELGKTYIFTITIVYLVMNFSNLNWIVAKRNLQRYYETGKIDVSYLVSLGSDATSQMAELVNNNNLDDSDKYILENGIYDLYEKNSGLNFGDFNYSKYFSNRKILKLMDEEKIINK